MKRPGSLAVSPDGRWIVVSVNEPSYDANGARSDLWLVAADGGAPARRLTSGRGSEVEVTFSADGSRIASYFSPIASDSRIACWLSRRACSPRIAFEFISRARLAPILSHRGSPYNPSSRIPSSLPPSPPKPVWAIWVISPPFGWTGFARPRASTFGRRIRSSASLSAKSRSTRRSMASPCPSWKLPGKP